MKQIEKLLTEYKPAPVSEKTSTRTTVKATNSVTAIFNAISINDEIKEMRREVKTDVALVGSKLDVVLT